MDVLHVAAHPGDLVLLKAVGPCDADHAEHLCHCGGGVLHGCPELAVLPADGLAEHGGHHHGKRDEQDVEQGHQRASDQSNYNSCKTIYHDCGHLRGEYPDGVLDGIDIVEDLVGDGAGVGFVMEGHGQELEFADHDVAQVLADGAAEDAEVAGIEVHEEDVEEQRQDSGAYVDQEFGEVCFQAAGGDDVDDVRGDDRDDDHGERAADLDEEGKQERPFPLFQKK